MFTGIVRGMFEIASAQRKPGLLHYSVMLPSDLLDGLKIGASVSVDGVCQTVVAIENRRVTFDAIEETLKKTTLDSLSVGQRVNIERAARIGDEIGGHILSGHVYGKAQITQITCSENNQVVTLRCNP